MLNIEKYKDIIISEYDKNHGTLTMIVERLLRDEEPKTYQKLCGDNQLATDKMIKWLASEYEEPLLNKKEMEYLSEVMKPFMARIKYVVKRKANTGDECEYIYIALEGVLTPFNLPVFKKGEMYKGMELDRIYTPAELGIQTPDKHMALEGLTLRG